MALLATPREILASRVTNVVLRSTTGGWTIGNPGSPIFTLTGAVGDIITDQVILDPFTAVIGIKSTQSNAPITITDSLNKEAASVLVWAAAQFTAAGRSAVDDLSRVADGKHNQSDRENAHSTGVH